VDQQSPLPRLLGVALSGNLVLLSALSQGAVALRTITFVYILGVVVLACVRRRDGAVVFLFGLGVLFATLVYTDLISNAALPRIINFQRAADWLPAAPVLADRDPGRALEPGDQHRRADQHDLRRLLDVNISSPAKCSWRPCSPRSSRRRPR
jgi:hypothetical protein